MFGTLSSLISRFQVQENGQNVAKWIHIEIARFNFLSLNEGLPYMKGNAISKSENKVKQTDWGELIMK